MSDILKILLCIDSEANKQTEPGANHIVHYIISFAFSPSNNYIIYYVVQFNLIEPVTCYEPFIFIYIALIWWINFSKYHLYVEDH
jgi:hypothetical protein